MGKVFWIWVKHIPEEIVIMSEICMHTVNTWVIKRLCAWINSLVKLKLRRQLQQYWQIKRMLRLIYLMRILRNLTTLRH